MGGTPLEASPRSPLPLGLFRLRPASLALRPAPSVGERLMQSPSYHSLEELYDVCGGPVYRLALRLCRSPQEAEDLCHDVFLRYWQHGRYDPSRGPVLAYLLLMTRSMALNRLSQRKNRWDLLQRWSHQLFPAAGTSPLEAAEDDEQAVRVKEAMGLISGFGYRSTANCAATH